MKEQTCSAAGTVNKLFANPLNLVEGTKKQVARFITKKKLNLIKHFIESQLLFLQRPNSIRKLWGCHEYPFCQHHSEYEEVPLARSDTLHILHRLFTFLLVATSRRRIQKIRRALYHITGGRRTRRDIASTLSSSFKSVDQQPPLKAVFVELLRKSIKSYPQCTRQQQQQSHGDRVVVGGRGCAARACSREQLLGAARRGDARARRDGVGVLPTAVAATLGLGPFKPSDCAGQPP